MIKSLTLGNKTFPNNIIQGPLAGISSAPFRLLTWQYSQPAFSCTEMISCKTLLHQALRAQQRYITKDPNEGPVCFQLASSNPRELGEAVKKVTDYGADLIDLNCGCPVKKIRSKGAGSRLLTEQDKLYQLISVMKQNTHVPVSIKIRVEGASDEKFNQDIISIVQDAGADFIVVHGRHWREHYDTPCRHEQIQFFVEQLKIPVIGNGDVHDVTSLRKMFKTGCAGVMIARAGVGQPWLIKKLIAGLTQTPIVIPNKQEIGLMLLQHVQQLALLLNSEKFAILQARKFAKYYTRELPNRPEFSAAMNDCENLNTMQKLCDDYFT